MAAEVVSIAAQVLCISALYATPASDGEIAKLLLLLRLSATSLEYRVNSSFLSVASSSNARPLRPISCIAVPPASTLPLSVPISCALVGKIASPSSSDFSPASASNFRMRRLLMLCRYTQRITRISMRKIPAAPPAAAATMMFGREVEAGEDGGATLEPGCVVPTE